MTEEIIKEELETLEDDNTMSAEDELATNNGWKPEDNYEGNAGTWIDSRTFNMRGELLERIKSQTSQIRGQDRKINNLEEGLKNLSEHNKKMDDIAFKKALQELKSLKVDALDHQDYQQVTELDDQITDLKTSHSEVEAPPAESPKLNVEVEAWIADNSWYRDDAALRGAADALTLETVQNHPELKANPKEVLDLVTKTMQKEFPEKFGKTSRKRTTQSVSEPGQADETSRNKGAAKKYTSKHLNEVQLAMGKTFVEAGAMKNLTEYAAQLAEIGELDAQKGA